MLNNKIIFLIIVVGLVFIPFTFAQDNVTSTDILLETSDDISYQNIYFNSSLDNDDGDGSLDSPYKYLTSNRIESNSNIYLADGEYVLDKFKLIPNYNAFYGESTKNTIITFKDSGNAFVNSGLFKLNNLTLKGASIYNEGTLISDNVIFKDSSSDYGGAIYSFSSTLNISNSYFINNSAKLGGAICDLNTNMLLINITAINNSAVYQGGAIYKMYGNLSVLSSNFFNNSAIEGEAIYCDISTFIMENNIFNKNNVFSVVNNNENFMNNKFINCELTKLDFYNINFERFNYTQMSYTPYIGSIPSSYDLRDYGLVSSVKDQGTDGNCWAFAGIAALESCILKATGVEYDFSEENMKNLMAYFSDYGRNLMTNKGGYNNMVPSYFASWMGPVNESDDKYIIDSLLSPLMDSVMHVQNIVYLPRLSYTDNDAIKYAILNYGGVFTGIYYSGLYIRSNSYYCRSTTNLNHAIVIVGWDDNYSKSNFKTSPPGDGAWICKNSWGSNWGDNGYFYVSYYDDGCAKIGQNDASFTFILNDTVKYDKIYQYDVSGITDYFLTNQSTIWYQNNFNATSDEILAAFSTYFDIESNYTVEIYVNNELKLTQNGSSLPGYFTIDFDEFIPVYKNDLFKIIIKLSTSSEAWIPISEKVSLTRTHYKPNTSFISYNGVDWIDFYDYEVNMSERGHFYNSQVACIKAFSVFNLTTTTVLSEISRYDSSVDLTAEVKDQYGHLVNEGYVIFECNGVKYNKTVNNGFASLSFNNLKHGINNLTANYVSNVHYLPSDDELKINLSKHPLYFTLNVDDIYYGDKFNVFVSLIDDNGILINDTVVLTIENKSYHISSNSYFLVPDEFKAGFYNIKVDYGETSKYYSAKTFDNVSVLKYDADLSFNVEDVYYGNNLIFNTSLIFNSKLINEKLILNINGINYSINSNGIFTLPAILDASSYNIFIYYPGSEKFNSKNITGNVKVLKANPLLESSINSVKYGEDVIVNVKLTGINDSKLNENIDLIIDNKKYSFNSNNDYILPIQLNASKYSANIIFNGNKNYNSIKNIANFTISKNNFNIGLLVSNGTYGEKTTVIASLTDMKGNQINEKLRLNIGDKFYEVSSNSKYTIPVLLNASTYIAYLIFEGNNNFNKVNTSKSFHINKLNVNLNINIENITYGDYLIINNTFDHDITLNIDDKLYLINANSLYQLPVLLNAGIWESVLNFEGNNNYYSNSQKIYVFVDKATPKLDVDTFDINYGEYIKTTVDLIGINNLKLNENVILTINNVDYLFKSNGEFSVPVILNASKYPINIHYDGNNNYKPVNKNVSVNINKIDPSLMINISNTLYSNDIIVKNYFTGLNHQIDEILTLIIDGKEYQINSNKEFVLPYNLDVGEYVASIIFNGNSNYNGVDNEITFNVYLNEINMDVNIEKNINNVSINVKLSKNLNETVNLKINNQNYNVKTIDGEGVLVLNNLNLGDYSVEALFNKSTYKTILLYEKFTIDSINTVIKADNISMYYHDGTKLIAMLTDSNNNILSNESINIYVNGLKYTRHTNENGFISFNLGLNSGNYLVNLEFEGKGNYINSSCEVYVDIKSSVDSYNLTKYYKNLSQFSTTIRDFDGNPIANKEVMMNINGVFYYRTTDSNGDVRLNINLDSGNYILTITNPLTGENSASYITVLSRLVENKDLVKYYRNASRYSVKVLDEKGSPMGGVNVTFNINGVFYTRLTNSEGVVSLAINLNPGKYIITAQYGDSKVSNTITVLSIIKANDITMKYRDGTKFKATILDGYGNPYPNQSVTFNINGVFYIRITDINGIAKLNINLQAGKYIITTMFNGLCESNTIEIKN